MSLSDPAVEVQSMIQKRGSPNRLVPGCPFSLGGGAGNRTPVRQGPTAGFSVRSPRFDVGSGLPETGSPHPSPLELDPVRESVTRGAVAISDVRKGSWRRKPPGTWTLFKRPVRSFRWRLLFAPCFASPGNSARYPKPSILPSKPVAPIFNCQTSLRRLSLTAFSMSLLASLSATASRLSDPVFPLASASSTLAQRFCFR